MNKKIRYSNQLRQFDCGPCCLVNASKFYGAKMSYRKEYKNLCDILGVDSDGGTFPDMMKELIDFTPLPYRVSKTRNNPKIVDIKRHVNSGNCIMLFYCGHVSLVIQATKRDVTVVNHSTTKPVVKLTNKQLRMFLKHDPKAFFLVANDLELV